ncbi:MAG: site-specific integrase [Magnetococcales bacterium]|nr:site-specific integrase [Magnetococcales bacterium]
MPKLKLTSAAVARLTPPKEGRVDYFDTTLPAFGLRLSSTGARKFFVMTRVNGQLSRLTLGKAKITDDGPGLTLAEARKKAGELTEQASAGHDPRQIKKAEKQLNEEKAANTFRVAAERFMRQHVEPRLAASTKMDYKWALFGNDTAAWANKPVDSITRADVRRALDATIERGSPAGANKLLAYLSKFFNWCAERDLLEVPPTIRIKPPSPKSIGERTLNHAEVADVWAAFEAEGGLFGDLFKLLLLTGQRRSETAGMRLSEISDLDGEKPVWEIPGNRTKNSRPHTVPLSPQVVTIIKGRPIVGDLGFLLTTTGTTGTSGYSNAKERVDAWIAKRREKAGEQPMPRWTLHDLRRTMVTMMNEHVGIAPHVVEACVNHVSGMAKAGVAGVYNKALYLDDRRRALEAWANYLDGIISPKDTTNVVKLRG